MLAKVHCSAVQGIVAHPVEVEVNDGYGETLTVIVSLIRRKHPVDLQREDAGARDQAALPAWR